MTVRPYFLVYAFISVVLILTCFRDSSAQETVLYASQAPVKVGNWSAVSDSTAAGGARLANPDAGVAKLATALANPSSYAQFTFTATAGIPYRIWVRGKAQNDSPYNDSIFVQFSGSLNTGGGADYRIGTTASTQINLEDCYGCGLQGWGWQDNGWGAGVLGPQIFFATSGTQTLRIQAREDGLSIDQIVISPSKYLFSSPGALKNDGVILVQSAGASQPPTPTPTPTPTPNPSAPDVVIWATNVAASGIHGGWAKESNSSAAGQTVLRNADRGAAKLNTALASPVDYFDVSFNVQAGVPYRLWMRGRADNDYWGNDSVFAQFSGSLNSAGQAAYRLGTTDALALNLEDCTGCGIQGWGWQDDGWGANVLGPVVYFQSTGTQTLRIQRREDGIAIDQIVLSSYAYLFASPGLLKNDNTILQSTIQTQPTNQPPQVSISANPTSGTSPLFVNFASTASDPDGFISSYSWSFGDGNTSSAVNPVNTYQSAGTYMARLTVTDNAGATASASIPITVSSPQSTATLRVMSWNIQFGKGTDNLTNWDRTSTWITNINPDIVALAEMPPDSISTLVAFMNQKTGRTWSTHFVPKYPGCPEGNLILTKYSILSTNSLYMSGLRSVAQATINVSGRTINFFATHLDPDSSTTRYNQVGELMNFASTFSESRIVAGDFNAGPDLSESIRMTSGYYDNWQRAMNAGIAVSYPDNPVATQTRTRRGRIDYIYSSLSSPSLTLQGTQIPDTRNLSQTNVVIFLGTTDDKGVRPSDHNPMIANFQLR